MVTFLLSGIWHSLTLNFVVWGLLQGIFLSMEALRNRRKTNLENRYKLQSNFFYVLFSSGLTYTLFTVSEVFGRAVTIEDSLSVFQKMLFERGHIFLDKTALAYASIGSFMLLPCDFRDEY